MDGNRESLCLPVAAAYPIFTIGYNNAGVFTATNATTKATLVAIRKTTEQGETVTCVPLNAASVQKMQMATTWTAGAALYQAANGKVGTDSSNSALAIGQAVAAETKISGQDQYGEVMITR